MSGLFSGSGFVTHAVIAEIADQATVETRQTGNARHAITCLEFFDKSQRIGTLMLLGFDTIDQHMHAMPINAQHRAGGQT